MATKKAAKKVARRVVVKQVLPKNQIGEDTAAKITGLSIEHLEIQSFKCFGKLSIGLDSTSSFPGQWTCIAGINGSGKTAVLQAISLCLLGGRSVELGLETLLNSRQRTNEQSKSVYSGLESEISMVATKYHLTGREQEVLYWIATGHTSTKIALKMNLHLLTISTYRRSIMIKLGDANSSGIISKLREYGTLMNELNSTVITIQLKGGDKSRLGSRGLEIADDIEQTVQLRPNKFPFPFPPLVLGYGANRTLSDRVESRFPGMSLTTRRLVSLFDSTASLAQADVLLSETSSEEPVVGLITGLLNSVFDGVQATWHKETQRFRFWISGADVSASDLPDGFRSSAAWLADLCAQWISWNQEHFSRTVSNDPAEIKALVLIDEIDLHLHPSLQRSLVPALRKALPHVQWVVTTHSPLVLGCFDKNEIIALDRQAEGGVRVLDRQIFGFSTDEIYEWLMGTDSSGRTIGQLLPGQSAKDTKKLAESLFSSPSVDATESNRRFDEMKHRLAKLQ